MTADENTTVLTYDAFLRDDERRRGDALEIGADFTDEAGNPHRVCWYADTGELTIERIDPDALDVEDFHQGVLAVEVAAQLDRAQLEAQLGARPQFDRCQPRTIARLRQRLAALS
ncbi:MAG TPA: hypothetical protein VLK58_00550 [Conexibacter sp.]|nr:hypothetical protein [Conexibacter sp.]